MRVVHVTFSHAHLADTRYRHRTRVCIYAERDSNFRPRLPKPVLQRLVMVVVAVELTADAYLVCLAHALTTEKEEVMGLLLGEVSPPLARREGMT